MELERDDFVVRYDASQIDVDDLIRVCDDAGFPASVAEEPTPETKPTLDTEDDPVVYTDALARAKREGKPLVLDFSAEWCAPCQQMIRSTFPDPKVAALLEDFVFLTIDTDEYPALTQKFGVVAMPDIRILSFNGNEVQRVLGYKDADEFAAVLTATLESPDIETK